MKKQIGVVGVDSGQLMVIDPCYVPEELPEGFYNQACDLTTNKSRGGQMHYKLGHAGLAVVFESGYGDGTYPVFAHYNGDGRITKIIIDLE